MTQPRVVAVMLVNGRQQMVERAVLSFRAQHYANKRLVMFDTGAEPIKRDLHDNELFVHLRLEKTVSIGNLRNMANAYADERFNAEVILHWDSDDWSHPYRMLEQVSFLQASGMPCVGYNEMLFWDDRAGTMRLFGNPPILQAGTPGEAWIYRNGDKRYALGTSLCYSAAKWKKTPFSAHKYGEDLVWINRVKCLGISSLQQHPRMIAGVHADNTATEIKPGLIEWKRAAEHDEHCRRIMAL